MTTNHLEVKCNACQTGTVRVDSNTDPTAPLVLVDGTCDVCNRVREVYVHATGADGEREIPG